MATTTMNISLPDELKRYVQQRAREGNFGNPSEFIRSLIREEQRRHAQELCEQELFANFMRNNPTATPEAWTALRAEYREKLGLLRREIDVGLAELARGEGQVFDEALIERIKKRGREALEARNAE